MRPGTEDSKVRSKEWATQICEVHWLDLFPHPLFPFPFLGEVSLISSLALYLSKALLEPLLNQPGRDLGSGSASAARGDSAVRSHFRLQTCLPQRLWAGSSQRVHATTSAQRDEMAAAPRATSASAVSLSRMPTYHRPLSSKAQGVHLPWQSFPSQQWRIPRLPLLHLTACLAPVYGSLQTSATSSADRCFGKPLAEDETVVFYTLYTFIH